ncbi:P33MX monooxygenase, partial [Polypterus senegalus]|nr:P33MX monooxygenase [Polypterus senegalus]
MSASRLVNEYGQSLMKCICEGGFALQSYRGAQKPSPMEIMRAQATLVPEEPANFKPPKMDIPVIEEKKHAPRSHNLKPRDMNVLTPSGF